jgi:hypothetical protein
VTVKGLSEALAVKKSELNPRSRTVSKRRQWKFVGTPMASFSGRSAFILLALTILLGFTPGQHHLVYWKSTGVKNGFKQSVLIIDGTESDITAESNDEGTHAPTVDFGRTRKGVIYGSTEQVIDGAYLTSLDYGFAKYKGKITTFTNMPLISHAGEYLLFLDRIDGMPPDGEGCAIGKLYHLGTVTDVGWMRRGKVLANGTVVGWYPIRDGKPVTDGFAGDKSPAPTPGDDVVFTKEYFKFKDGKRTESLNPF